MDNPRINKPLTKKQRAGRPRLRIDFSDFVREPDDTMLLLAELKNDEGHSWRTLADEVNELLSGRTVSHTLVREVALGYCESDLIDYALGLQDKPPPVQVEPCPDCGEIHEMKATCTDELEKRRRKRPHTSTVAFHFHDHALAGRFRKLIDGHEGGRYEWVEMIVEEVEHEC